MQKHEINSLIKTHENLNNFLDKFTEKGFMYELICEYAFVFNVIDTIDRNYLLYFGKSNNLKPISSKTFISYIKENAISGNTEGCGDIKYVYNNVLYVISCKYYQNDNKKSIDDYDISKILQAYSTNSLNLPIKVIIICNDKDGLLNKINRLNSSENKTLSKQVYKIYGFDDVQKWYQQLHLLFKSSKPSELVQYFNSNKKRLILRPHQYVISSLIQERFMKNQNEILINGVPRCGKTFICGDILKNYRNILLLTPRPTSCKDSYFKMIDNFVEFSNYSKLEYNVETRTINLDPNTKNLLVVSRQLLIDRKDTILDYSNIDLVILDEAHLMCTQQTIDIVNELKKNNKKIIYMTGTSDKVEYHFNLKTEQIIRFTLNDVMNLQKGVISYHEKFITEWMKQNNQDISNIQEIYSHFPKMKIYNNKLNISQEELSKCLTETNQFSYKKLFAMNSKDNFIHRETIKQVFDNLFGSRRDGCISKILEASNNQTRQNIILVYLPYGIGLEIDKVQKNILKLFDKKSIIGSRYEILSFSSKSISNNENIMDTIESTRLSTDKDIIVLLGSMLELGCSIPHANFVVCMHDCLSYDKYTQQIFRCLTENKGKVEGYVIDCNRNRILYNLMKMLELSGLSKNMIKQTILENDMINLITSDFEIAPINHYEYDEIYEDINDLEMECSDSVFSLNNRTIPDMLNGLRLEVENSLLKEYENVDKDETQEVRSYLTLDDLRISKHPDDKKILEMMENNNQELIEGIKNFINYSIIIL